MIDEFNLEDFLSLLKRERDERVITLLRAIAAHNPEITKAVLEILSDQYPTEVEEILGDYREDDDEDEGPVYGRDSDLHSDRHSDPFEDENLYESDIPFADYDMEHEKNLDSNFQLLLDNPEAITAILIFLAQNPDLDPHLVALYEDPDLVIELEEMDMTPVPSPFPAKKKK